MTQSRRGWELFGALCGVLFVAFSVTGLTIMNDSDPPAPEEPSASLARYLADQSDDIQTGTSLMFVGLLCFLVFLGYLHRQLRRAEGEDGWLATVALGGGLTFAGLELSMGGVAIASTVLPEYGSDAQVAKTLYVIAWDYVAVLGPPLAALVGATAALTLRARALPVWLGWLGIPVGLVLAVPMMAWIGLMLALPWLAAVAVALLLRAGKLARPSPTRVTEPAAAA